MKKNVQNINSKKRKTIKKHINSLKINDILKPHAHNKKKGTMFCEECGKPMHEEKYEWHSELREYFLVGDDGKMQLDRPLDDRYVEDDVRELIAMKKKFG